MVFQRCELRTTDPDGARAFYRAVVGEAVLPIAQLPERAQQRGAPSHWLGHLVVPDVPTARASWIEAGATPLGPTRADGVAVLKDPLGSPVALTPQGGPPEPTFAWCELHTADVDAAWAFYGARQRWRDRGRGDRPVRFLRFADANGLGGGIVQTVGMGAHPHWLFYFPVSDLEATLAELCASGARPVFGPADGVLGRVAALDDPFGAAFGLVELAP